MAERGKVEAGSFEGTLPRFFILSGKLSPRSVRSLMKAIKVCAIGAKSQRCSGTVSIVDRAGQG